MWLFLLYSNYLFVYLSIDLNIDTRVQYVMLQKVTDGILIGIRVMINYVVLMSTGILPMTVVIGPLNLRKQFLDIMSSFSLLEIAKTGSLQQRIPW